MKERTGTKRRTIDGYKKLLPRINDAIGHMKLTEIRPQHLNMFYEQMSKRNSRQSEPRAVSKIDLKALIRKKKLTLQAIADKAEINVNTVSLACKGSRILESKAAAIAKVLNTPITKIFIISRDSTPLSNKTILEYHRLINTIFKQADKELLIPYNPAAKATPPKANKSKIIYFEYDDLEKIQSAVDKLSLKWRTIIHLLMITGCRRAELCGLKWDVVEWERERLFIHIDLLREYKAWYDEQRAIYGSRWHDTDFLFFQEKSGKEGLPMSPDTVTRFLDEFSQREGLPHLNPHAFRHTMASILCYNHIDPVSISHRLGHSRVSTTVNLNNRYTISFTKNPRNIALCRYSRAFFLLFKPLSSSL